MCGLRGPIGSRVRLLTERGRLFLPATSVSQNKRTLRRRNCCGPSTIQISSSDYPKQISCSTTTSLPIIQSEVETIEVEKEHFLTNLKLLIERSILNIVKQPFH